MDEPAPLTLDGKTALVTGAARRIGAAIVDTLHDAGMRLAFRRSTSSLAGALEPR